MKKLAIFFLLDASISVTAQNHSLEKIWETDTTIAVPESALPDFKRNVLFISLIDGDPLTADGRGGVSS